MPIRRMIRRPRRVIRKRKAGMRKRYGGYRRVNKTLNSMKDKARVVEVLSADTIQGNESGIVSVQLSNFARALAVSKNFRFYRCTKVELEFIPFANVFAPGQAFPELYYQTDVTAATLGQAPTQASMEGRGVLPVKWTKPIKRYYSPAVLRQENLICQGYTTHGPDNIINSVQPLTATPVKYKWYMTEKAFNTQQYSGTPPGVSTYVGPSADPTNLSYYGCSWLANTPVAMAGDIGRLVIKVHWEFKQPLVPVSSPNETLTGVNA